jgi:hypothetical protein
MNRRGWHGVAASGLALVLALSRPKDVTPVNYAVCYVLGATLSFTLLWGKILTTDQILDKRIHIENTGWVSLVLSLGK